jgi:hypothetical protein
LSLGSSIPSLTTMLHICCTTISNPEKKKFWSPSS